VSLPLAIYALGLTIIIAFPAGIIAASRRNSRTDLSVMGATQLGLAIPNFWFALLLVLVFSITLRWFSAGGFPGWSNPWLALRALTLPAIALALPQASILARVMRSALLDTLGEDYIRSARAKGLTRRQALWRHALRNALIPVLTILGLQFSFLLAGGIIIENVFFLPGLGRLVFQGITQRDLIVVKSVVMLLVFAVILVNFLVDLSYAIVDPRLRRQR
jgi:peptide/nickel transport system permease protein